MGCCMHTLHLFGARMQLAAARAVISAQIVELHPTMSVNWVVDPK